jgi:hypothetical protein
MLQDHCLAGMCVSASRLAGLKSPWLRRVAAQAGAALTHGHGPILTTAHYSWMGRNFHGARAGAHMTRRGGQEPRSGLLHYTDLAMVVMFRVPLTSDVLVGFDVHPALCLSILQCPSPGPNWQPTCLHYVYIYYKLLRNELYIYNYCKLLRNEIIMTTWSTWTTLSRTKEEQKRA